MSSTNKNKSILPLSVPRAHTIHDLNTGGHYGQPLVGVSNFRTFQIPPVAPSISPLDNDEPAPYLMGFPAPGLSYAKNEPGELIYSRPLNEDELRAREIYWGKVTREVTRGLPKFDGRDFYPPSPIKISSPTASSRSFTSTAAKELMKIPRSFGKNNAKSLERLEMGQSSGSISSLLGDPFHESTPTHDSFESSIPDQQKVATNDAIASLDSWDLPEQKIPVNKINSFLQSRSVINEPNVAKTAENQRRNR